MLSMTGKSWRGISGYILLTGLFSLAYSQSPLYTSNQNQYFLHGLARAGYGFLAQDWLANTLDPTPAFSALVECTIRLTHLPGLFYIEYSILMGIYLFSLLGIIRSIYAPRQAKSQYLVLLTLIILVHSAGMRYALSHGLGVNWEYVLEDGLADQRLLGPVFQPSVFGVFLLLSVYLFLQGNPVWAALSAVLAATFHPTYLLSAGALVFTYMLLQFRQDHHIRRAAQIGAMAAIAILPIFLYVYRNFGNAPAEIALRARQILVNYRIPHHALFQVWFDATAVVKILILAVALFLVRKSRLFPILFIPAAISFSVSLVQILTGSTLLALIFPWRLSTFLVPLSTTIILAHVLDRAAHELEARGLTESICILRTSEALSVLIIALCAGVGVGRMYLDFARQAKQNDRMMMAFVSQTKASGQVYLIPPKMQDFRLVTGAPAYVEFKSIPYQDADVLEWYRRIQFVTRFYKQRNCQELFERVEKDRFTHLVMPLGETGTICPGLARLYSDAYYAVYALPNPPTQEHRTPAK